MTNACSGRGPALVLVANTRGARIVSRDAITTGSVGIQVALDLSEEYSGLAVTVVFRAGEEQADWAVIDGEPVMVPPQCLQEPGVMLYIGVYASDGDGNKVIPTVWASAGAVRQGVEPSGYDPVGPAPSWAAQVQQAAAEAVETANSVRADADAGAFDGEDGYSPTATVEQLADGATISITDKDGTTTATIHDGADGATGPEGPAGYSPSARVTQSASGATITVTDQSGTTTADISNGAPGEPGQTGPIGPTGEDGFSPTVDVQPITGGHEVTITDADGAHSFEVMDGDPAEPGSITDEMLAPDGIKPQVAQLWGNQLTGTLSGTVATASDAYAAPPMALTVEGSSTQDGTPTPDAPVQILSVDDLLLVLAGKNMLDAPRNEDITTYGMTWHFESDGTFHAVSGKANSTRTVVLATLDEVHWPAGDYYLTFDVSKTASGAETKGPGLSLVASDGTIRTIRENYSTKQEQPIEFTLAEGERPYTINFAQSSGTSYSPDTVYRPRVWPAASGDSGYEPYVGTTVPDLLPEGTSLRSLPDGTRDTLNLSYLRPSSRDGWAWYSRELEVWTKLVTLDDTENWRGPYNFTSGPGYYTSTKFTDIKSRTSAAVKMCNIAASGTGGNSGANTFYVDSSSQFDFVGVGAASPTLADWKALLAENPAIVLYALATPTTTQLDPIELPQLPASNATVWCDGGSAQPTYQMEYVRDTSIVIANLEAAIADLATS